MTDGAQAQVFDFASLNNRKDYIMWWYLVRMVLEKVLRRGILLEIPRSVIEPVGKVAKGPVHPSETA